MALTAQQIATVKSTAPIVKQYGTTITTTFYRNMLSAHPELKNYFSLKNQQSGAQQTALANAVFAYAAYIDDLPKLNHAVERIAQKHASLFIKADQYPIVGKYLVGAFAEVLGSALTPEIAEAWIAAYGQLADVFIKREKQIYDEAGEWQTWRKFKIVGKEAETDSIISLYLEPVDGKALPGFKPGQYVSLQLPIPELNGLLQSRQFSLSVAPENNMHQYRVSVKKEAVADGLTTEDLAAGKVAGVISNRLHERYNVGDEVELSPPHGEFFFDATTATANTPVVLLSAGVGATPLVSILDSILKSPNPERPVTWAHAARQAASVCFGKHIRDITATASNIKPALFVKNVQDGDKLGRDYNFAGPLSLDKLADEGALFLEDEKAEYFICGPEDWMVKMRDGLTGKGVPVERVHLELFRTGDV
ncbi:flavohemoglobin [Pochonia chlamydosporia 170]|uniref:nitric oxide dioxygenase n=1 Tax=Pochonia chlamydosporia 170 TaxID=1380566 RepID=A0A179F3C7_METCM|nr:flavohemoglobin [Pochonia chlamydosporia 170]OAQ59870.1 flavohemoglobin [Pochonia chlamydosporia 170]